MNCHTRLWYYFSSYVQYFTQREVLNFTSNTVLYPVYMLYKRSVKLSYGVFTTVNHSIKYLEYCKEWGGGYVVKTYPSIDPHSTPPPVLILYKCQIISSRVVT